jgi:hypothetical protein
MSRVSVVLAAGLILLSCASRGQTSFDVRRYGQFLSEHSNLEYPAFLGMYPAGAFRGDVPAVSPDPAYLAAIDSTFRLTAFERSLLKTHGFLVSSRLARATFLQAFQEIFVRDLPVFVSTDALLYAVHLSYDELLKELEVQVLIPNVTSLLTSLHGHIPVLAASHGGNPVMMQSLRDVDVYLTLPLQLLGAPAQPYFVENAGLLDTLHRCIGGLVPRRLALFAGTERDYDFSQFTVRGHYTRDPGLASYFRAMIWLGRTELYLIAPEETIPSWPELDIQRQCIDALLLREAVIGSGTASGLTAVERMLTLLLGEADNVTAAQLDDLAGRIGLASPAELAEIARFRELQDSLATQPYADQRIISQILFTDPLDPDRVKPASAFLLLGQRFILDGYITGNVVYDKIKYNGADVLRMLPSSLDVLFALGNDAAAQLLEPELTQFHYAANLAGLRYLIDSYDESYWTSSVFCAWLGLIRALNPPGARDTLPPFMQTAAWWQEKMNTQLASWAQLRHDNILYAKQPYTVGWICSYPESFVEPNPVFYSRLGSFARAAAIGFGELPRAAGYFNMLAGVADTLAAISTKELRGGDLTAQERSFLRSMLLVENMCGTRYTGWYPELLYGQEFTVGGNDSIVDYIVADIHTSPTDEFGGAVGWVQHVGTGPVELAVVVASSPGGAPMAYIGPVQVYYEHLASGFKRITDEEWAFLSKVAPTLRPDWVNLYLAGANGGSRGDGACLVTAVEEVSVAPVPSTVTLLQNYPNPFNGGTVLPFALGGRGGIRHVALEVFDVAGRNVKTLFEGDLMPGNYTVTWDGTAGGGRPLASGVYLARLRAGGVMRTAPLILLR